MGSVAVGRRRAGVSLGVLGKRGTVEGVSSLVHDAAQRRFAIANLIAQIGIIVTGGAVRVTGSGLGCSSWPMCEPGAFTPVFHEASSFHPFVEFGNRTLTGVLGIIALGLLWSLYRKAAPARPDLRPYAWAVLILIAIQAIVGGMSVWATLHPAVVGLHMALSLGLVSLSTVLVYRLFRPRLQDEHGNVSFTGRLSLSESVVHIATAVVTVVVALLGVVVTGTGPHSGDAEKPYRFAIDPIFITRLHAVAAWLLLVLVLVALYAAAKRSKAQARPWLVVLAMLGAQGVLGYIQYFSGLNPFLVVAHMLGSGLTVVAITWAMAAVYSHRLAPIERASDIEPVAASS